MRCEYSPLLSTLNQSATPPSVWLRFWLHPWSDAPRTVVTVDFRASAPVVEWSPSWRRARPSIQVPRYHSPVLYSLDPTTIKQLSSLPTIYIKTVHHILKFQFVDANFSPATSHSDRGLVKAKAKAKLLIFFRFRSMWNLQSRPALQLESQNKHNKFEVNICICLQYSLYWTCSRWHAWDPCTCGSVSWVCTCIGTFRWVVPRERTHTAVRPPTETRPRYPVWNRNTWFINSFIRDVNWQECHFSPFPLFLPFFFLDFP